MNPLVALKFKTLSRIIAFLGILGLFTVCLGWVSFNRIHEIRSEVNQIRNNQAEMSDYQELITSKIHETNDRIALIEKSLKEEKVVEKVKEPEHNTLVDLVKSQPVTIEHVPLPKPRPKHAPKPQAYKVIPHECNGPCY